MSDKVQEFVELFTRYSENNLLEALAFTLILHDLTAESLHRVSHLTESDERILKSLESLLRGPDRRNRDANGRFRKPLTPRQYYRESLLTLKRMSINESEADQASIDYWLTKCEETEGQS